MATISAQLFEIIKNSENSSFEQYKEEFFAIKNKEAITKFFHNELQNAMDNIYARAIIGARSANLLEYTPTEHFYISNDGEVIRVPEFQRIPGVYMYSIYKTVMSETFANLINEYTSVIDVDCICWRPKKNLNVVEVRWKPDQFNNWEQEYAIGDYDTIFPPITAVAISN